jgi:hypothetical protein
LLVALYYWSLMVILALARHAASTGDRFDRFGDRRGVISQRGSS